MKKLLGIIAIVCAIYVSGCGSNAVNVSLTPSSAEAIDDGQSVNITATVTNDSANKGVTWTLSGSGALASATATSVAYDAPASGSGSATITATSVTDTTKTKSVTINVSAPPSITTTSLPAGTEGTAYSQNIAVSGGAGALTYSISAGAPPAGLSLSSAGAITGTPTGPNTTSNFTVKVTDSSAAGAQSATKALSITINLPPAPTITTTTLPVGVEGTAYSQTLAGTCGLGPCTWSKSAGSLPNGLSLSSAGAITGTPTGPNGTSNFTVAYTDSSNPTQTATQALSITINLPPAPTITTTSLPAGVEGAAYNQTLAGTCGLGPCTWSKSAGTLPNGLSLSSAGAITGTPTGPNGTSNFTVAYTDSSNPTQTATQALSITINLPPAPAISPTSLPNGNQGTPYSQNLSVSSGLAPYSGWTVSSGAPPTGVTLSGSGSSATLSGTPSAQGTFNFTISVNDSSNPAQTASQAYTVTINPPAPLSITTTSLPNGTYNSAYSATISATGGIAPYTFSLDGASSPLPSGLNPIATSNNQGVISGTPTTAGTFSNIIVDVTDSTSTVAKATYTLTITVPTPLAIAPTTSSLPNGTQGNTYTTTITANGGVPPYTFALDASSAAPPAGLNFSATATQATISGTPTATGTTTGIIVDVTDSEAPAVTVKQTYSLTIVPACGTGSESLLNGQYAFVLGGFDANGPAALGATFNADGAGHIATTVGVEDINSVAGVQLNQSIDSANSSYQVGSDHRGCLTIATSAGTQFFRFSLGAIGAITPNVASEGHVIRFDSSGENVAGELRQQNSAAFSTSSISGSFAFGVSGAEVNAGSLGRFAAVGMLSLNGGGSVNNTSVVDVNDNGNIDNSGTSTYPSSPVSISGGSYSISASGRGTLSINPSGASSAVDMVVYVVSSSEVLLMSSDPQSGTVNANSLFAGRALKQTGPFSTSSLNAPMVLYATGLGNQTSPPTTTRTSAGIVTVPSSGSVSYSGYKNDSGTVAADSSGGSVSYSVASSGRVTLPGGGGHPPIFYLVSANEAFALFTDNSVESGFLEPQSGSSFSNASANGTYAFGTIRPADTGVDLNEGVATFDGAGNVSGTSDDNPLGSGGSLNPASAFSQTYSIDSNGIGHLPGGCTIGTNCDSIFVVISSTNAVVMDTQSSNPNPALQLAGK